MVEILLASPDPEGNRLDTEKIVSEAEDFVRKIIEQDQASDLIDYYVNDEMVYFDVEKIEIPESGIDSLKGYMQTYFKAGKRFVEKERELWVMEKCNPLHYQLLDGLGGLAGCASGIALDNIYLIFFGTAVGYVTPGGIRRVWKYLRNRSEFLDSVKGPRDSALASLGR